MANRMPTGQAVRMMPPMRFQGLMSARSGSVFVVAGQRQQRRQRQQRDPDGSGGNDKGDGRQSRECADRSR